MKPPAFPFALGYLFSAFVIAAAPANSADTTPGNALRVGSGDEAIDMPLRHTKVSIEVTAFVARTTIEQVFDNPLEAPVEAVSTLPLGHRAAVDDFEMTVADRTVRGEIKRRDEAREVYRTARGGGYQAALLEQERPNIFTQSVANLAPGKPVTVRLRTVETLRYERGTYRLVFPLVVAPRYVRGGKARTVAPGQDFGGVARTKSVEKLTPPYLAEGTRPGHDVELEVAIDAGVPLRELRSVSHRIDVDRSSATATRARLASDDTIPNKDFQLSWSVGSERPAVGFLAHRSGLDGFFTLLVQPKGEIGAQEATPKEITFVVDTSGSMSGIPIEASRRFIAKALRELGPRDTFNVIRFSGDNEIFSKDALPNEPAAIERAITWVNAARAGGGTEMLSALRAAFARPRDPNRLRMVVFFTDGQVGADDEILASIGGVLGDARIHTVGIGAAVNRHLLDRMAELGHGSFVTIRPDENADDALEAFRSWVTRPYLTDLTIDWGALPVADESPDPLPDLSSGQTLNVVGRYLHAAAGDVVLRGKLGGAYWEQRARVTFPETETKHAALASLWARGRIDDLLRRSSGGTSDSIAVEVTSLALDFSLMSPFTSFVAVDDSTVVNPGGAAATVRQALPLPEGSSFEGIFGTAGPKSIAGEDDGVTAEDESIASREGTGGVRVRVIDYSDKSPVIGAAVTLNHITRKVATTSMLTQSNGTASFPAVPAGRGYMVTVIMDGYTGVRQDIEVAHGSIKDWVIALAPEHVERVVVTAERGTTVDLDSNETSTKFSSDFIADIPVAGRFYQNVLSLSPGVRDPDGDGNPNASGARERDFKTTVGGISDVDPLTGQFLHLVNFDFTEDLTVITSGAGAEFGRAQGGLVQIVRAARLRDLAFRVLADLADDGKLSPAGGKPALAALLATQLPDGTIAEDVTTHAVATWALIEAAAVLPNEAWIATARTKAVDHLVALATPAGWPRSVGGMPDGEATRWASLALGKLRPDVVSGVAAPQGTPSKAYARLRDSIVAKRPGVPEGGAGAFDRLVATIGRGRLKSFFLGG